MKRSENGGATTCEMYGCLHDIYGMLVWVLSGKAPSPPSLKCFSYTPNFYFFIIINKLLRD